jgi:hypothetical protein
MMVELDEFNEQHRYRKSLHTNEDEFSGTTPYAIWRLQQEIRIPWTPEKMSTGQTVTSRSYFLSDT